MVKLNVKKNIFYNDRFIKKKLDIKELPQLNNLYQKRNVDINRLLKRVKVDEQTEKKKKIIFFSLGILLLGLMGTFVTIIR